MDRAIERRREMFVFLTRIQAGEKLPGDEGETLQTDHRVRDFDSQYAS
jgi:hypothetical protein